MKKCEYCGSSHDGNFGSGRFCNRKCSNGFSTKNKRKEINDKVSKTFANKEKNWPSKECLVCGNTFLDVQSRIIHRKTCSRKCSAIFTLNDRIENGKKSASVQAESRRSKNEIYFSELCMEQFSSVKTNFPMFSGWDADVIIEDIKIAVLWNGKWHYEKLTQKHSLKQVQNRDRIKIKEIKNFGYTPYVIKDMGGYNKCFVEEQFDKFLNFIKTL